MSLAPRRRRRLPVAVGLLIALGACGGSTPRNADGDAGDADGDADRPDAAPANDAVAAERSVADAADASNADGGAGATDGDAQVDAGDDGAPDGGFVWNLPEGFPVPAVPADNPMTASKVRLGRYLFYDVRLSHNGTQSCASCHKQELAFTDGRATALGSTGQSHPRAAMSLVNVAYASTLTWANPLLLDLEHQALVPMFGTDPVELGLTSTDEIEQRLRAVPGYALLFADAWPGDAAPVTVQHVVQALASFERTIVSGRSPFDRYLYDGDASGMSASALRGYTLFNSGAGCFHCHLGFDLTDHVNWSNKAFFDKPYHNTGLYNLGGTGAYPEPNTGVYHVTQKPTDMGRFKAPTLRNIALTAPYMHDGSIASLDAVLDHYQAGGRTIASGPYSGNGSLNPYKDPLIEPLELMPADRADLIEYLRSLTDDTSITDPDLSAPSPLLDGP
ncbi:MAG TPA: di-heme enzyme [Polyangia bacterium]|nr:di-heme enzyme [Polyangia bacterium]